MQAKPDDAAASAEALKFFDWAYTKGTKRPQDLDYVPMPARSSRRSRRPGRATSGADGKPVRAK